jgi:maltooligosyltrehalose synthase
VAFARQHGSDVAVTIVPRVASRLLRTTNEIAFDAGKWADTIVVGVPAQVRINVLTGKPVAREGDVIPVSSILDEMPLAFLSSNPAAAH